MRKLLLLILLLSCTIAYSQDRLNTQLMKNIVNCENAAFNASEIVVRNLSENRFDSISIVLNRWEQLCGTTEPIFRIKILNNIQQGNSIDELINTDLLYNYISVYQSRSEVAKENNYHQIYEYNKIELGYIPINSDFDLSTAVWASNLVEQNESLSPVEKALCLLYSNEFDQFWELLKEQQLAGSRLQEEYNNKVAATKKMAEANIGFLAGVTLPTGSLSNVIGVKPVFGVQLGMKKNKIQYDLTILLRAGKPRQEYQVFYQGETTTTKDYLGGYIGADFAYELSNDYKNESDLLFGIGYDGFDAIEGDTENDIEGKSINSLNLNFGMGHRFYLNNLSFVGIQAKYNFVNYNNKLGTDLNGDYFSLIVTYNFFGNVRKQSLMKQLKIR